MRRLLSATAILISSLVMQSFTSENTAQGTTVYICVTGKVYHSTKDCRGLKNATHKIKAVSLEEAKKTRRPCKICY